MKRALTIFAVLALLYAGAGLLPGRTFAPLDLPLDAEAWKADPTQRVRVSNTLLGDVIVQFVPWDREIRRLIGNGEFPWVNRFAGDRAELFANPQTALFSPFVWPRLLFGLDGWALMAILKILAGALGMYWLARELDVPPPQAMFSGVVFALSGYSIVWLLYPITGVFAFIPALAAAALRLMKIPSARNGAAVIVVAALCTAGGHPETLLIGVAGVWMFLAWEAEKRPGFGLLALIPPSAGAALGFLLLAVQLAPFLYVLSDSYADVLRPNMPHSFREWGVVSQILPGILGTPLRGELDLTAIPMAENFNLRAGGFVGAVVLLLIALAWRELSPSLKRGLVIGLCALAISWFPPGLWAVARNFPVVRVLTLEYLVALFVLFASLASGPAVAIVANHTGRRKIGAAVIAAGLLLVLGGLLPAIPQTRNALRSVARSGIEQLRARGHLRQAPEVYEERLGYYLEAAGQTTVRRVALPGLCWALAGAAMLMRPSRRRPMLLSLAATAELIAFGWGFNPAVKMEDIPAPPPAIEAVQRLDPARNYAIATHFELFPANLGTLYGVRDAISYDALSTKRRVEQLLPAGYDPLLHTFNPILSPEQVRALAPLGVRYVLSRDDVAGARRIAGPPKPAVGVYEVPDAVPLPLPVNSRPTGIIAGIAISMLAFVASLGWLQLFRLPEGRG